MEWQPIETAPKDGTHFLMWSEESDWPEAIRWVDYDEDVQEELGAVGYWAYSEEVLSEMAEANPTHWMPYEPPKDTS